MDEQNKQPEQNKPEKKLQPHHADLLYRRTVFCSDCADPDQLCAHSRVRTSGSKI